MNVQKNRKQEIIKYLQKMLDAKVETAEMSIALAKESRDNDTKSSAGDKYETGRAMMQLEMDKNEAQRSKVLNLKRELALINIRKEYTQVEFGCLVITNQGNYFMSIGVGKIKVEDDIYYSLSFASPIGKLLQNKKIGQQFHFQGKEFIIENIV